MQQVAPARKQHQETQRRDRPAAPAAGPRPYLRVHQPRKPRRHRRQRQHAQHPEIRQARDIQLAASVRERQEQADAVGVHPIEKRMRRHAHQRHQVRPAPGERLAHKRPHHQQRQERHRGNHHQRVRDVPVVVQVVEGAPRRRDDIDIRRARRQQQHRRRMCAQTIEARPAQRQSGQRMRDGVHEFTRAWRIPGGPAASARPHPARPWPAAARRTRHPPARKRARRPAR